MHRYACLVAAVVVGGAALAAQQPPSRTPAPATRGTAATYASNAELTAAVKKAAAGTSNMVSAAVKNTDQYRINVVHRSQAAGAIAHDVGTEVHHIIEGSGTLVTGGTIVRPTGTGGMATIQGGETRHVGKGDVVLIPENTPHWYSQVEGSITYLEVRFNVPTK
jgi:mannose-6-phosphate isomerase-like protein (cupin superfamily)